VSHADRWKYLVTEVKPSFFGSVRNEALQAELDKLGAAGWELVHLTMQPFQAVKLVLKRPV
jgi:hypothetical protein